MDTTILLIDTTDNGQVVPFTVHIDEKSGEFIATSTTTGHVLKFPAGADLAALAVAHNEANANHVYVELDENGQPLPAVLTVEQTTAIADAAAATADAPTAVEAIRNADPVV